MGANLEVDVFLARDSVPFTLPLFRSLLQAEGFTVESRSFCTFDAWPFENEHRLPLTELDRLDSALFRQKFTCFNFLLNHAWDCTLITSFDEDSFDLSFSLDTNDLHLRADEDANAIVKRIYERITDSIVRYANQARFRDHFQGAAMGMEYSVYCLADIGQSSRWLVPASSEKKFAVGPFNKEYRDPIAIFTYNGEFTDGDGIVRFVAEDDSTRDNEIL